MPSSVSYEKFVCLEGCKEKQNSVKNLDFMISRSCVKIFMSICTIEL